MSHLLKDYEHGFKQGKCSLIVNMEDDIPGEVKEKSQLNGNNNNGLTLLKVVDDVVAWKWHPLFIHTESMFEVLDRKVPS